MRSEQPHSALAPRSCGLRYSCVTRDSRKPDTESPQGTTAIVLGREQSAGRVSPDYPPDCPLIRSAAVARLPACWCGRRLRRRGHRRSVLTRRRARCCLRGSAVIVVVIPSVMHNSSAPSMLGRCRGAVATDGLCLPGGLPRGFLSPLGLHSPAATRWFAEAAGRQAHARSRRAGCRAPSASCSTPSAAPGRPAGWCATSSSRSAWPRWVVLRSIVR